MTLPRTAHEILDPSVQRALEKGRSKWLELFMLNPDLSAAELRIGYRIGWKHIDDATGFAFPSKGYLAETLGFGSTTTADAIKKLEALGLLVRVTAIVNVPRKGLKKRQVWALGAPDALFVRTRRGARLGDPLRNIPNEKLPKNRKKPSSENSEENGASAANAETKNVRKSGSDSSENSGDIEHRAGTYAGAPAGARQQVSSDSDLFITASDGTRVRASQLDAYEAYLTTVNPYEL